jgi:Tol biopolymer transport system component
VLREGVECPSLSPDNSRIAFKSRLGASRWRLHLLDVATLKDAPLAETRSVDDQPEWLDDTSVAYMLPATESGGGGSDIWMVSVKTGDAPRVLLRQAYSPVRVSHP